MMKVLQRQRLIILLIGLVLLAVIGRVTRAGDVTVTTTPSPGKVEALSLSADHAATWLATHQMGTRLKLTTSMGIVTPAFSQKVEIPVSAKVMLKFTGRSSSFKKGATWAEVDPERMELEGERLKLNKEEIDRKSGLLEAQSQRLQFQARFREIERTLALMDMPEPSAAVGDAGGDGGADIKFLRENATKIKVSLLAEKELIEKKLAVLAPEAEAREARLAGDYALRKMEYDRLKELSILTVPCDATVKLLFDPQDGRKDYPVKSGVAFAEIVDERCFFIGVPVSGQNWRGLQPTDLVVQVRTVSGGKLEAHFVESRLEKFLGREEQLYVFEFAVSDVRNIRNLSGGMTTCDILQKIEPSRIVPKLALIGNFSEAFQGSKEWGEVIVTLFPNTRIVGEGESQVAIAVTTSTAENVVKQLSLSGHEDFRKFTKGGK